MIRDYLARMGFATPGGDWYAKIAEYLAWYRGSVDSFHRYNVFNGTAYVGVRRSTLGMAKTVAEDHASLLLNERVKINPDAAFADRLQDILRDNNFRVRANQLVELAYALGTGAFVEYRDAAGAPAIDYIRADMIFPLAWDNGEITDCAFGSLKTQAAQRCYYVQIHSKTPSGYVLRNIYLDADTGLETALPDGLQPEIVTGSQTPFFQIVKPNLVNNYDLDCPMGMSIYGNAIDTLKAVDLVWDSYCNEFILGRKRVMVPMSMARIQMAQDGTTAPLFDPRDTIFYVYQQSEDGKNDLREVNMAIRAQEHETGLQRALNQLSKQCGLGNDRYQFDGGGVKTATEVISEKSELYQNLKKNELILNSALIGMTRALAFLDGYDPHMDVTVAFDDSIIEDRQAKLDDHIKLTGAGLESKMRAIMELYKVSEADAQMELERIAKESSVSGTPDDWFPTAPNQGGEDA